MTKTVGEFLFDHLKAEGITEIFGVPGDFNFSLLDTLEDYDGIDLIDNRNELNAGYAADGYAQVKGLAALITTFGVGELSASNAIAGAYSENIPLVHIAGSPDLDAQEAGDHVHHTLMDGNFEVFRHMYEHITAYAVKVTKENAGTEIPKAIRIAKKKKKPVYLDFPIDQVTEPVGEVKAAEAVEETDEKSLEAAVDRAKVQLEEADQPVMLVDFNTLRFHLEPEVQSLAEALNVPVAQMMQGKGGFNEQHPQYIGMYGGAFGDPEVQKSVEAADCIIAVGMLWSDFNLSKYTAKLDTEKMIIIHPHSVEVAGEKYEGIHAADALEALQKSGNRREGEVETPPSIYDDTAGGPEEEIAAESYYPRFQRMLKKNDILVVDTGTLSYGMSQVKLPEGTTFISHGAWQSIGYGTPAALGASVAARDRRVLLFIGEGAFQFTAQELSTIIEKGYKPVIFLLNNQGYTIERYLNTDRPYAEYNDVPVWDYMSLVDTFSSVTEVFKARVTTNGALEEAIENAEDFNGPSVIELFVTDPMDAPLYLHNLREHAKDD
ncbi:alpha-keto acid decarboxylase family protein [Lacicoccus alkaliphilus]|uniref:Alpha-keto-acid decarboxylase n=1 Tax=Lacicoccus alkaliphilus DSM 16010 TaxID=1123231 RepID=A0A1M7ASZ2_9BACL|nr:thiamine pyrophosphate-binding protein [Salinicoccus alkaliphilus]SHL45529.1 indolepyruvate decarboxylase [Salinicoccus alkaliphilus DSM 16010]